MKFNFSTVQHRWSFMYDIQYTYNTIYSTHST